MTETKKKEWSDKMADLICDATRADLAEFAEEITTTVIETRKDDPNGYPGIKVPIKPKPLDATRKSLVTLLQDWGGA